MSWVWNRGMGGSGNGLWQKEKIQDTLWNAVNSIQLSIVDTGLIYETMKWNFNSLIYSVNIERVLCKRCAKLAANEQ